MRSTVSSSACASAAQLSHCQSLDHLPTILALTPNALTWGAAVGAARDLDWFAFSWRNNIHSRPVADRCSASLRRLHKSPRCRRHLLAVGHPPTLFFFAFSAISLTNLAFSSRFESPPCIASSANSASRLCSQQPSHSLSGSWKQILTGRGLTCAMVLPSMIPASAHASAFSGFFWRSSQYDAIQ